MSNAGSRDAVFGWIGGELAPKEPSRYDVLLAAVRALIDASGEQETAEAYSRLCVLAGRQDNG